MTEGRSRARGLLVLAVLALSPAPRATALETRAQSGPVSAVVTLTPDAPVIGDAITLEISATAEPEVDVLMPEFGEALDRFSITQFVPREGVDDQGRNLFVQRYTLQVDRSGEHVLPSVLIEFVDRRPGNAPAPEGSDAFELLTEPIVFQVESVVVDAASADLSPPLGELAPLGGSAARRWIGLAAALAVLAAASPFALRAWARRRMRSRRASAYDVARSELDAILASPRPSPEAIDAFFVALSGLVRRYLEDRFEVRSPELTTEEFMEQVSGAPDLGRSHQELLRSFLQQADLVKFAHHIPSEDAVEEALAAASRFLDETREAD